MGKMDDDFLKELVATFSAEAEEHVSSMSSLLIELEKAPAEKQTEIVETIFREAHSLKGAARVMNMTEIETISHSLESVFGSLKNKEIALSPELFDLLHQAVARLNELLSSAAGGEQVASEESSIKELVQRLENARGEAAKPPREKEPEKMEEKASAPSPQQEDKRPQTAGMPALTESVRISTTKLESILLQAEELLSAKQAANHGVAGLREIDATFALWKKKWKETHPDIQGIQLALEKEKKQNGQNSLPEAQNKTDLHVTKTIEFLEWESTFVKSLNDKISALHKSAENNYRSLDKMVENLLNDMKEVLMLPFSSFLNVFPAFIRRLSRDQGKEVDLVIEGGEVEIDRRILEKMKDPVVHLVRNCIDHGIEKPEERVRKKKPPHGTIKIIVSQKNSSKVELLISDDGAGINLSEVRSAAARLGVLSKDKASELSEQDSLSLVFQSGISTSPIVTNISGRGIGLAIVGKEVAKLGGIVSVESVPDEGTTFRMILPVTVATFHGVLVRVDQSLFVVPAMDVEQVAQIKKETVQTVANRETIELDGQTVSFVHLTDLLELSQNNTMSDSATMQVVVLGSPGNHIAFLVDEILGEQEVLVKGLGGQLSRVRNIAGATVLGTGEVVPILNVPDLMKSAVGAVGVGPESAETPAERAETRKQSLLVVDDSITARTLLKNILESAGYEVKTAVDGVDALTTLKTAEFDLVMSDVDMPRMNGFDLTERIRKDSSFSELPVVLVTALESREDRERGIDAGANAYIVKSSFEQSDMLEIVRRLI